MSSQKTISSREEKAGFAVIPCATGTRLELWRLAFTRVFGKHGYRMGLLTFNRSRFLGAVIIAVLTAVSGWLLLEPDWRLGEIFLRNSYDSLHSLGGTRSDAVANSPVVV